jgi:hypothetical protein
VPLISQIFIFLDTKILLAHFFIREGKGKKKCCVKLENPASSNQLVDSSWLI